MNVLIIEDETPAANQLSKLLNKQLPDLHIVETLDSVESAVNWLRSPTQLIQLIFMDIQLADGLSFDIFQQVRIESPVIFTTAFDHYSLKAFQVNSIDYLLKPIDPDELNRALTKYQHFFQHNGKAIDYTEVMAAIMSQNQPEYKKRFLVKSGQELKFIFTSQIQYFFSEDGLVFAQMPKGNKYHLDYYLEQIEKLVDPNLFFRINRKVIIQISSIHKISTYFNSRLLLELKPNANFDIIVSRDRVSAFKQWLDQ
jgi:DNA-binding LytR/AlgR family response regulator